MTSHLIRLALMAQIVTILFDNKSEFKMILPANKLFIFYTFNSQEEKKNKFIY